MNTVSCYGDLQRISLVRDKQRKTAQLVSSMKNIDFIMALILDCYIYTND